MSVGELMKLKNQGGQSKFTIYFSYNPGVSDCILLSWTFNSKKIDAAAKS